MNREGFFDLCPPVTTSPAGVNAPTKQKDLIIYLLKFNDLYLDVVVYFIFQFCVLILNILCSTYFTILHKLACLFIELVS